MEFTTIEQIEERLSAIKEEMNQPDANLDELKAEVESLVTRKKEIKAEQRKAELDAVIAGEIQSTEITDFKENEKMEEKRTFAVESAEYRTAFMNNLLGKASDEEVRAIAASGAAVPTGVANKFFEKMKKLAPMLEEITLFNVSGNLKVMAESVRDAAEKHTENGSISAGANDAMISVTLGGFEFAKLISISKAAAAMSIDAFEQWLVDMIAGDLARAVDNYILNDATNGIAAMAYTTGDNQILATATTGYTYKNVCDLVALLPAGYDPEAKMIMNKKTLYGQIANIKDSQNRPIFVESAEAGNRGYILGYPVVVDDYVTNANNAIYLGAYKNVVGNFSEAMNVERNDNSGFRTGSIDFRGFCVFDSKVAQPEAIVRLVSTTA